MHLLETIKLVRHLTLGRVCRYQMGNQKRNLGKNRRNIGQRKSNDKKYKLNATHNNKY